MNPESKFGQREEFVYPFEATEREEESRRNELFLTLAELIRGGRSPSELGSAVIKAGIKRWQCVPEIRDDDPLRLERMAVLKQDQQRVIKALGSQNGPAVVTGMISECGFARVLAGKQLRYQVFFPDMNPENYEEHKGIDWWIRLDDLDIAVQLKSAPFIRRIDQPLQNFESQEQYQDIIADVSRYLPHMYDTERFIGDAEYSCKRLLEKVVQMREHDQSRRVVPAIAFTATPGSNLGDFSLITAGLIKSSPYPDQLWHCIDSIDERYTNN